LVCKRKIGSCDPNALMLADLGRRRAAHERNDIVSATCHRQSKMPADETARP
jgi:hypothetical protein